MVQRQSKRTEQQWMDLIQECRTSGLSDKDWCEQRSIPVSTFYNRISKLRKKACDIPMAQKSTLYEPQQVIPLEILDEPPLSCNDPINAEIPDYVPAVVLSIQGYRLEIANHAAKGTILNTLSALQQLC